MAENGLRSSYNSRVINGKNLSFSLLRKVLPFDCIGEVEFFDISAVKMEAGDSGP